MNDDRLIWFLLIIAMVVVPAALGHWEAVAGAAALIYLWWARKKNG